MESQRLHSVFSVGRSVGRSVGQSEKPGEACAAPVATGVGTRAGSGMRRHAMQACRRLSLARAGAGIRIRFSWNLRPLDWPIVARISFGLACLRPLTVRVVCEGVRKDLAGP